MERTHPADLRALLLALGMVLALHAEHLPPWLTLLALLLGLWRLAIAVQRRPLPRPLVLLPFTCIGALGVVAAYHGMFARDACVALLVLMAAMKTLEAQGRRDVTLLVLLGYFLVVASFLYSQSLVFGSLAVLPVVMLTASLVDSGRTGEPLPWRRKVRLAGLLLAQSLPLMFALFLLFPRIPGPLWGIAQDAYGKTGLSDSMAPGSLSRLGRSAAVAFRATFDGHVPGPAQLYWRGPVLWQYDGREWSPGRMAGNRPPESLRPLDAALSYSITLEPHNQRWLLLLDMPAAAPAGGRISHDRQALSRQPVRQRTRYQGTSYLRYQLEPNPETLAAALQLPQGGNRQTRALAASWQASGAPPQAIVQNALAMFRREPFVYTLSPPLLGDDAVDGFLFGSRRGFCEHYAGSFVFLMRAAGVPARVVTGYQGGEFNPTGNYLLVRQYDAHAWAEVWLEGRGWMRVDPTAAVAPQRVEAGIDAALPDREALPLLARRDFPWLRKLYLQWDALNNGWNQWVLGYDQQRQMELLSRLAGTRVSWQDMVASLMLALCAALLGIGLALYYGGRRGSDPALRAYRSFLRKLARAGISSPPQEGPLDLARRAAAALPQRASLIRQVCGLYAELRYGRAGQEQLGRLRRLVKDL